MTSEYDEIEITDENERLFKAWASVEIVDKDGELIPMEAFARIMPKIMERGGVLIDNHTNRVVGKIVNYEFRKKGDRDGLLITGKIFNHFTLDDQVWDEIKKGIRKGISFGGKKLKIEKSTDENGKDIYILSDIEGYEFSVVRNPANPEATIEAVNMLAKGDDEPSENEEIDKSAISALRNIQRGKNSYGKPISKDDDEPDVHVSISHRGDKWYVKDEKTGKILGEHKTKKEAVDQLQAIYVNADKSENEPSIHEHDITEDNVIDENQPDIEIEKRVKKLSNGKWAVVHCHGPDKGKPIKVFDTKEEAERMHRAIMAHEYGGKDMKKEDENVEPEGAEVVGDNDETHEDIVALLTALTDKINALEAKIEELSKADEPSEDDTDEEDKEEEKPAEDNEDKEDDEVAKSSKVDVEKLKDEIIKSVMDKLGVQEVQAPRPEAPVQTPQPEPQDDMRDFALKVARGEIQVTYDEIERKKREAQLNRIRYVLEE